MIFGKLMETRQINGIHKVSVLNTTITHEFSDFGDGKLECVGLTGLTHLTNVYTGIRSGIRIGKVF